MPAVGNLTTIRKSAPELKQSLREGRGAMPAFHNKLQETEIDSLIHHILTHFQQQ
jgi:mono/diheme cytochrome c family protein